MSGEPVSMRYALFAVLGAAALAACEPGLGAVLPAGSVVPSVHDDAALDTQIDESDQVDRMVARISAFADGAPAHYWGFGMTPDDGTMPLYRVCRRRGALCDRVEGHPWIAEYLPGDSEFRHYGRVTDVPVTEAYAGELITSRGAIDDAVSAGLVEAPRTTDRAAHVVIVHRDVRVDVGDSVMAAPSPIYVRGMQAAAIDFSATHGLLRLVDEDAGTVLERNVYILTREGEDAPLSEPMRGVDLTGDGDMTDTNTILGVGFMNTNYTPLWRMVTVTVPATYASFDTAMDETMADYQRGEDMFTIDADYRIEPIAGAVISHEVTEMFVDCPIQSAPGQL